MATCFQSDIMQESFNHMLCEQAAQYGNRIALTFLGGDGSVEAEWSFKDLDRRARAVGRLLEENGARGKRVLLLFPPGLDYVAAFFGALYAGAVAVPAYPPRYNQRFERLRSIAADAQAKLAITVPQVFSRIDSLLGHAPEMKSLNWLTIDGDLQADDTWQPVEANAGDLAFLQYTSGSTAQPRGVMVTHGNLLHNERMIQRAFDQTENDIVVSWLPPYHDMGLIGTILQPLFTGSRAVLMSPVSFLQRPVLWLETISRYGATTSGGPNFAYELCAGKITEAQCAGLDLSTWRVAFNGAEPVRATTLDRFAKAFGSYGFRREAFQPCYGLAEATLLVSGQRRYAVPTIRKFDAQKLESHHIAQPADVDESAKPLAGCGISEQEFVIVDPETSTRSAPGAIGEVWISGPSVADGYWNRPLETEHTFKARLQDADGSFLRTGDLGFTCDGELFITGRLKDLLIIRGRNLYPHDIEETVRQSHPALTVGGCAVFSIEATDEEKVVVVQEVKPRAGLDLEKVIDGIRQTVSINHEVELHAVLLTIPKALARTSSGKIQRYLCRSKYLNDEFKVVARWEGDTYTEQSSPQTLPVDPSNIGSITTWLVQQLAACLRVDVKQVDPRRPVSSYGLDSLRATELTHVIETALGVELSLATVLEGPPPIDLARLLYLKLTTAPTTSQPLVHPTSGNKGPLSSGQRALWFMQQLAPASAAYNLAGAIVIRDAVDIAALREAFQSVTEAHAILRTRFIETAGQIEQHVSERAECNFVVRAASKLDIHEEIATEAHRPFDLRRESPLRAILYQRGTGEDVLLIAVHHIAADLWSLGIVIRDIGQAYQAAKTGAVIKLTAPPLRYLDYVQWQREFLSGVEGEEHGAYWQKQLAGELPIVDLPSAGPRSTVKTFAGAVKVVRLNAELTKSLKRLSEANHTTLFVTLLAAFHALLYRYTGQEELITGTTTSGRTHASFSGIVGYFVNPLVIRSKVYGKQSFEKFLASMKETVLEALAHKEFPFPLLVERLQPERNAGRSPVFDVAFAFQNAPRANESGLVSIALGEAGVKIDLNGMQVETLAVERRSAQFDLTLMMAEVDDALTAAFEYNTDLFDATTIERLAGHFENLLGAIVRRPEEQVGRLPLLAEPEVEQQLRAWNDTAAEYGSELCLHELVEASVARTPDAVAVSSGSEVLTYEELNRRAEILAEYLRGRGIGCEDRVALLLERSPQLLVAILGVLKSGAAYVPLDAAYPEGRLRWMMADAQVKLLLTEREVVKRVLGEGSPGPGAVELENPPLRLCVFEFASAAQAPTYVTAANAAYVIYTSGSTGVPKAAVITHTAAVNYICWARDEYLRDECLSFPFFSSLAFDLTVTSIFTPIISGNSIVIYENDAAALNQIMQDDCAGVLKLTPGHLALIKDRDNRRSGIKRLLVGGEALTVSLAQAAHDSFGGSVEIINEYGPTEATVGCMIHRFDASSDRRQTVPIGVPAKNAQIYLFDDDMNPVATGVAGEVFIGGAGLSRGYLNAPHLTAACFVPHPYAESAGARLYRTGDLARRLSNGGIEFIGRKDHQVKVRGYRIELNEIETALTSHPQIKASFVFVKGDSAQKRLVACVVHSAAQTTSEEVKGYLAERLPEYMIPTQIVGVSQIPLTTNGKVDRKALDKLIDQQEAESFERKKPATPLTRVQEILVRICSEILGTQRVRIEDNFFELGGHSLLAVQLVSRVREVCGVELALSNIFEHPTLTAIARLVETALKKEKGSMSMRHIVPVKRDGAVPLSFAQERLWFLHQLEPGSVAYNVPCKARFKGTFDVRVLERTLSEVLRRHESLRTTFTMIDGKVTQVISPAGPVTVPVVDLTTLNEAEREAQADCVTQEEAATPFNLADGPPVRLRLVRLNPDDHLLLVTMHHILTDEWSLEILIKEIATLYHAFSMQQDSPLPELPIQYADYAVWQRNFLQGDVLEKELSYWKQYLEGAPPALELPFDRPRTNATVSVAGFCEFELTAEVTTALKAMCRKEQSTLFMLLLAAFNVLLYRYTGQRDIVVGTPSSGRNRLVTEKLIGFFVNTLVLRTQLSGGKSFRELLREVRENALSAYSHNELPFEKVVEEVNPTRSLSHSPLFQVMFIMENALRETMINLPGVTMIASGSSAATAKFDMTLSMGETAGRLGGIIEYNTDLFEGSTIKRMIGHFENLLGAIALRPDEPVGRLRLLDEQEEQQQLVTWNATTAAAPAATSLHQLVEASVARTPDAIAVSCGSEAVTYKELNRRAEALAGHLRQRGVRAEDRVALLLERSVETVVAILGVLKSGGAYVPLDPAYPVKRLQWVLADGGIKLLLTEREVLERVFGSEPVTDTTIVYQSECEAEVGSPSEQEVSGEQLAYVIYTSGSTGQPKGVCIEHRQAVSLVHWGQQQYTEAELTSVLASTSLCFDLSIFELFVTLSAGGTVVMAANALALAESGGSAEQITLVNTVPSAMRELIRLQAVPESVEIVNLAGEALPAALVEELYGLPQIRAVYNLYGPSEDTTYSTGALVERGAKVTIGRSLPHKQAHVLGEQLELLPVGVTGELYLAGAGLARGYLKAAAQTAERFVPHPYSAEPGARLYRTGDLGRWQMNGEVEFLGRRDQQVKIRGYRIELGEIETAMLAHPQLREAVVIVKEDERGDKRLLSYVVQEEGADVTATAVTQYLSERVPGYMVPQQVVIVSELPLTANGKVDRKALAQFEVERAAESDKTAPRTPVEEALSAIWKETLEVKDIGVKENFFDLGGHSLLATQVVSRVREVFDVEIALRTIFQHPTVEGLATVIEELQVEATDSESLSRILAEIKDLSEDEAAVFVKEDSVTVGATNESL